MGILAYVIYVIMKFARLRDLDNYNDTFRELWQPYPALAISFEIFYIVIILAAVAAAINGAALLVVDVVPSLGTWGSTILVANHPQSCSACSASKLIIAALPQYFHRHPHHRRHHDNRRHR